MKEEGWNTMKETFEKAWKSCVSEYREGRVNSECTLQALLYSELRKLMPDHVVLCEPRLELAMAGTAYPDIVVLSSSEIVAVAELKFVPHHYPRFRDDIAMLANYATKGGVQNIVFDPGTGKFDGRTHRFSKDCWFVFAVIGHGESEAVDAGLLMKCFGSEEGVNGSRFLPLIHEVP